MAEAAVVADDRMDNGTKIVTVAKVEENSVVPVIAEVEEDLLPSKRVTRRERYKKKALTCAKKFSVFLLSYVGLTCTVVAYSILGGFLFMAIEKPHEVSVRRKVAMIRKEQVDALYRITEELNILHKENWTRRADEVLRQFQVHIYNSVQDDGWTGSDDSADSDPKWSFAGALLFSVTVITTIGYGFTTPKTVAGRVVTMLYAVVGIPLTFLCLTNIGRFMASCFRALYGRTFCVSCRQRFLRLVKSRYGGSRVSMDRIELQRYGNAATNQTQPQTQTSYAHSLEIEYTDRKDCHTKHEEAEVPIIVCLFIMVWYIFFGAILFTIWETSWDLFIGSYFCFITLSTIGFGDVVPGFSAKDWDDQVKQVACTMYLLFGLSMLAMCFDLMQQRGRGLAKRFAQFLGLVDS